MILNFQSDYISLLVRVNQLDADKYRYPVFFPGMLFGSFETWWGRKGCRASSHEGVDICFFAGAGPINYRLDETVRVPVIADGRVSAIIDDLLGKTVVVRHGKAEGIAVLYAHVRPEPGLAVGDGVKRGEICAAIADTAGRKTPLLPHLHISMVHEQLMPGARSLTWPILNRLDRAAFVDPLPQLADEYEIRPYDPETDLAAVFAKSDAKGKIRSI